MQNKYEALPGTTLNDERMNRVVPGVILAEFALPGLGCQAPGRILLVHCTYAQSAHPFVTWYQNAQTDGCFHGHYFETRHAATVDFVERCQRELPYIERAGTRPLDRDEQDRLQGYQERVTHTATMRALDDDESADHAALLHREAIAGCGSRVT